MGMPALPDKIRRSGIPMPDFSARFIQILFYLETSCSPIL